MTTLFMSSVFLFLGGANNSQSGSSYRKIFYSNHQEEMTKIVFDVPK